MRRLTSKSTFFYFTAFFCFCFFASSVYPFTRFSTIEFKLLRWFINNPSLPQTLPMVDISEKGSLYAVTYVFSENGSDDLTGSDSEWDAVREAFSTYESVPGSSLQFIEETLPIPESSTRLARDGHNLIFWDETGSSATDENIPDEEVALTVLTYNAGTGELLDADIRMNGQDYTWVTDGADRQEKMDVLSTALHEIGFLVGLDVSMIDTAPKSPNALRPAMYPLRPSDPLRKELTQDDKAGVSRIYPAAGYDNMVGSISGTIYRADGQTGVYGAHVIALDPVTGNPVVSALSGSGAMADSNDGHSVNVNSGNYTLYGLPPGSYFIAVQPLDGGQANASSFKSAYSQLGTIATDFVYELYNSDDAAEDAPGAVTLVTVEAGGKITGIDVVTDTTTHYQLMDQGSVSVPFQNFSFPFYGVNYTSMYVNANGNITFGAALADGTETPVEFAENSPQIAALWDDLNPEVNGADIIVTQSEDVVTVTYSGIPEYPSRGASTFKIHLYRSGTIEIEYVAVSSVDDAIVGLSPGTGEMNFQLDFSGIGSSISFKAILPIFEQFLGSGDDDGDPATNDPFDLDGATLSFVPNTGNGYDVSVESSQYPAATPTPTFTFTPTHTPTNTPTATATFTPAPDNQSPAIVISPTSAELVAGESLIVQVTASDADGDLIQFSDSPENSGTFGDLSVIGFGRFAIPYTFVASPENGGLNEIQIIADDGKAFSTAPLLVYVEVPPTPTPSNTPTDTPTPSITPTYTPIPNEEPTLSFVPKSLSLIVGETKTITVFGNDADRDSLSLQFTPNDLLSQTSFSAPPGTLIGEYKFTAEEGQEGIVNITFQISDGKTTVDYLYPISVFAKGTTPSPTPTPTSTWTPTITPTITSTPTLTPTPTATVNMPPNIEIEPPEMTLLEGERKEFFVRVSDPNQDAIENYDFDPQNDSIRQLTFRRIGATILEATYEFRAMANRPGINKATFTASDGKLTTVEFFYGRVQLLATPTPTPVPQGDIVVAQGEGGGTFVHRRNIPDITIATNSMFRSMPGAYAAAIGSAVTRAVYVSTGDVDGNGTSDIVTSYGPFNPQGSTLANVIIVREVGTNRVIGHPFQAFPHNNPIPINNPYGEVRTAVGHLLPGKSTNQIVTAHGVGGNNAIRLYEYTGQPLPNAFQLVSQFTGLAGGPGNTNLSGAITVAAGDLTGDGIDELVVGQTNSRASTTLIQVLHLDPNGNISFRSEFFNAFPTRFQGLGGVNLAIGDVDGDGMNEVIASSMGDPEGIMIGDNMYNNFVTILKPVKIFTFIRTFERVDKGVFHVFESGDNPSGAVNMSVGKLVPSGKDSLVVSTDAIIEFNQTTQSLSVPYPVPNTIVKAFQLNFAADGSFSGLSKIIPNRHSSFPPYPIGSGGYTGEVNVAIREFVVISH